MIGTLEGLFELFVFDPSLVDLLVWFPQLSWGDFCMACALVITWRTITNRVERFIGLQARRAASWGLLRLALLIRP
jgi:hypothetical protein